MRIFVTGVTGQLGSAIAREFAGEELVLRGHADLELTSEQDVLRQVRAARPDVIINCAAYNNVDGAQDEPASALNVNAFAVRSLAKAAAEVGATLVHYSTDFVFNGLAKRPYAEDDRTDPEGYYAASKLLGEWFTQGANKWYVLRVESLYGGCIVGSANKTTLDKMLDSMVAGRETVVFSDRTVSPSFVVDVAAATRKMLEIGAPYGVYHCVNSGHSTWEQLARYMAERLNIPAKLVPKSVSEVRLRVPRPQYCALSNAKLAAAGVPMPTWQDALDRYLAARMP